MEEQRLAFIKEIYPQAKSIEQKTGVPAIAIMAQAALESGWGDKRIGNNLFGVKGKGEWALTTEYDKNEHAYDKYKVTSKEKVGDKFKFKVWLEFQSYPSVEACLMAHNRLLFTDRYKHSLRYKHSPKRYLIAITNSGYATAPDYKRTLCGVVDSVVKRLKKLGLL